MSVVIKSSTARRKFRSKQIINIGTNPKCDFFLELDYELIITIQHDPKTNKCQIINNFKNPNVLFKGDVLTKITAEGVCRINLKDSNEYLEIFIEEDLPDDISDTPTKKLSDIDAQALYGDEENAEIKMKMEKAREPIENARIAIMKQIAYPIAEIRAKIKSNMRTGIILHIALFITSILSAFAVANYMMGLKIQESARNIYLATNVQAWVAYTFVVAAICLMLKQGVYLSINEKILKNITSNTRIAKNFMLWTSSIFIIAIYAINLTYYSAILEYVGFAVFLTIFFIGIMSALSIACGYFKANASAYGAVLNKYEFREDLEGVLKAYRLWIERYVNSLSYKKLNLIKDRLLMQQLKTLFEVVIGIITAPFLAYGVSNTLAICFPESAGWVRLSGFRFSPVFLTLSTFLIIFAFFAFVNAFLVTKKIQASEVIKQDGFVDYRQHAISIYGLEGTKKLESDRRLFFTIGGTIVFIEFMMNIFYFMSEIGSDFKGVFLSFLAAAVPTALLLAETFIMACTGFDVYACDELLAKVDKE